MLASQAAPRPSKAPSAGTGMGERAAWASHTSQSLRHRPAPVDVDLSSSMVNTGSYAGMPHSSDSALIGSQSQRKDPRGRSAPSGILVRLAQQNSSQESERPKAPAFDLASSSKSPSSNALRRRPSQSSMLASSMKFGVQSGRDRNVSFHPDSSEELEPMRPGSFDSRSLHLTPTSLEFGFEDQQSPSKSSVALPRVNSCKSMNAGTTCAVERRAMLGGLSSKSSGMLPSSPFDASSTAASPAAAFPSSSSGSGTYTNCSSGNNTNNNSNSNVAATSGSCGSSSLGGSMAMSSMSSTGRPTLKLLPGDLKGEDRKAPSPSGASVRSMGKPSPTGSRTLSLGSLRYPSLKAGMEERTISNASTTIVDSRPGTPIDSSIDRSRLTSDWFDGPTGAGPGSSSSGLASSQLLGKSSCAGAGRSSLAGSLDQLGTCNNLCTSQGFDKSAALLVLSGLSQSSGNGRSCCNAALTSLAAIASASSHGPSGISLLPMQPASSTSGQSATFSSTCPLANLKEDSKDWAWAPGLDGTSRSSKAPLTTAAVEPLSHRMLAAVAALEQTENHQGTLKAQPVRTQKLIRELKEGEKIYDLYFLDEVLQEEGNGGKVVICRAKEGANSEVQLVMKIRRKKDLANQGLEEQFRKAQVKVMNLPVHPGILPVHALYEDEKFYYVVMTKAEEPSFFSSLLSDFGDGCMPDHAVQRLMRELLEAVDHIHRHGMLHRDLKPDNIVMHTGPARPGSLNPSKRAMLIDFDHADADWDPTSDKKGGDVNDVFGTLRFSAPEALQGQFSAQSDLYSIGTILYLLITGSFPFPEELYAGVADGQTWTTPCRRKEIYERQRNFKIDFSSASWSGKEDCKDLCAALLAFDPEERPFTAREALRHPWFRPFELSKRESWRPNRRFLTR